MQSRDIIDAIDSYIWYFDIGDEIVRWIEDIKNLDNGEVLTFRATPNTIFIWVLCVLLFGEYGTAPTYGWIVKTEECKEFLMKITKSHRLVNAKEGI